MNKKEWLDFLYYDLGKQQFDFLVCGLKKTDKGTIATPWKKYSELIFPLNPWEDYKIQYINQRQIFPNEVVLDIEEKDRLEPIIDELNKFENINKFYVFETGSRGYHIHIFFKNSLNEKTKAKIINYFQTDMHKASDKTMIALEWCEHWKSGKIKRECEEWKLKKMRLMAL